MAFDRNHKCIICQHLYFSGQGKGNKAEFICDYCFGDELEKMVFERVREKGEGSDG